MPELDPNLRAAGTTGLDGAVSQPHELTDEEFEQYQKYCAARAALAKRAPKDRETRA